MNKKTILITGGNGFIGTRIGDILRKQGHNVLSIDLAGPNNIDLSKKASQSRVTEYLVRHRVDVVCHMAALVGGGKYLHEKEWDICSHNAQTDINVLTWFLESRIPERFVYCSSSMVFQNGFENLLWHIRWQVSNAFVKRWSFSCELNSTPNAICANTSIVKE